jgi:Na+/H+ antiporter NhaC
VGATSHRSIFGSVVQGILPYGAQMITAVSLSSISAGAIIPYLFYPYLLAISALAFILIPALIKRKSKTKI